MQKISVIITCYNYGKYIEEAIDSVLNQTYQNFEIVIVNDGSTDNYTINVLEEIKKNNPEIILINQKNTGVARARNNGIKMSTGDFFLPLDADDKIEPRMLEKCLEKINENNKLGFVYTYTKFFDNFNTVLVRPEYNFFKLLKKNYIVVSSLVRREAYEEVNGYDKNMKNGYEDWEFFIRLGKNNWFGSVIKEPLFLYREHGYSQNKEAIEKHTLNFEYIKNKHYDLYNAEKNKLIRKEWAKKTRGKYLKVGYYVECFKMIIYRIKKQIFLKIF